MSDKTGDGGFGECGVLSVFASAEAVLETCRDLGARGYLIDSDKGLTLIAPVEDARRLEAKFEGYAFLRDLKVRARGLPAGVTRLTRKAPTGNTGRVDGRDAASGRIWGWFAPGRVPDRRLLLFQGETQVAEVALDVFRPDLYEAGIGDGIAGFQATVPDLRMDDPSFSIRNRAGERLFEAVPASAARKSLTRGPGTPLVPGALPKAEETGHFCADLGAFKLDYHVSEGNSKQLIVFSPGFLDKGRFPHPYFQRMKWAAEFDATCVFLADPTLLLGNTQIGWFLGDAKTHYMPAVADHIGKLAQSRGMTPADVLFFGSSAGGFSSIGFAAHLRGARALAINPQTDALRLHSPTQLAATLRSCFGMENVISARAAHAPRLVLTEMFRALGHVPPMTIWQNAYDRYHVDHHLMPFLDGLRALDLTDSVEVHLAARPEDGHDPPGLPVIRHLFDR